MRIDSKLPDVGVTIFTVMTQLANEAGAINLSQGFPDFDPSPDLIDRVSAAMTEGRNQYAPMQGLPALREKIAEKTERLYGASVDPETEITVTSGATEAVFDAITAVVRQGDEVILFEPAYDAYVPVIRLNGGTPVYVQYSYPEYRVDWDMVQDRITPRTRLLILNSPHNPTGAVWGKSDIEALRRIIAGHPLLILSDEVYEHIIFDGQPHRSMTRYPELAARSFVISSFGKTYHTTGWKIGYCLAPEPLSRELQRIHQYVTFASNTPMQYAFAAQLNHPGAYESLPVFYQEKRDLFLELMEPSRFRALPCSGTYFVMMDYSEISDTPDTEFARWMTTTHNVAAIPPSVFYHDGTDHRVLRFCFAKNDDTLKEAAERLCRI